MSPLAACLLAAALAVAAVAIAVADPPPCTTFLPPLIPCTPYITRHGDSVPDACCSGVKAIASITTTRANRVAACECFKAAASHIGDIDYDRVAGLPSHCHAAAAHFNFTATIDCNT
ncbi:non-specific lipid-transfer protein 1-like [Curcuma longa]|uniref:non-specific lipid-transfer protein 1-like n=1 Tax=Curcuma longa TaxID=136217 RepID=UPI003D9F6B40